MTTRVESIVNAAYALVSGLSTTYTMCKGQRVFNAEELPAIACYRTAVTHDSDEALRTKMSGRIVYEAHKSATSELSTYDPSTIGEQLISAIRTLVEAGDRDLGNLIILPGLTLESHEIRYPDDVDGVISVAIEYSFSYVERYGSP